MYLTRAYLNPRRRGAIRLLGNPQRLHAAVLAGVPPLPAGERVLWRLDTDKPSRPILWIVSPYQPDLTHLTEQAGLASIRRPPMGNPSLQVPAETARYGPAVCISAHSQPDPHSPANRTGCARKAPRARHCRPPDGLAARASAQGGIRCPRQQHPLAGNGRTSPATATPRSRQDQLHQERPQRHHHDRARHIRRNAGGH